ncbi:MAG: type II toxin-antitoxin system VapC family toxin [Ferrovibrio sp.]|uniref:type II toxin-antitoxin system VapC family toxin n=1 Tax=Ferrovibrio sp. TaxID=1917215 RepID=UPI00260C593B|nr:type II toxin-antitoxin system VapC family toxin [Ferrovibrio sp.]MCW0235120.1 type II toxin-antitoxin system VapC family toxin [Ferrovibrio sp.]
MIILDTNVASALMRPETAEPIWVWLFMQDANALCTTSITVAEMFYGARILPAGTRRERMLDALSNYFDKELGGRILPFDEAAALEYALLMADRRRQGRPLPFFDAQIAAIARAHGAAVATRNVRDFADCGIDMVNPWETGR